MFRKSCKPETKKIPDGLLTQYVDCLQSLAVPTFKATMRKIVERSPTRADVENNASQYTNLPKPMMPMCSFNLVSFSTTILLTKRHKGNVKQINRMFGIKPDMADLKVSSVLHGSGYL